MNTPDTEWDKPPYVFQFSFLGNDGKEHFEVMNINDHMNVEDAVKLAYQHAREHPKGRVNTFASTSLLISRDTYWKERVQKAQDEGYRAGYAVAETISHMDYDDAQQCLEEYRPTPITKDNLK